MSSTPRLLTLKPGSDVVKALADGARGGFVQASGEVAGAEVRVVGDGAPMRSIPGRATLVSLMGPAEGPLTVCLVRAKENSSEVVAGILLRGKAHEVYALVYPLTEGGTQVAGAAQAAQAGTGAPAIGSSAGWAAQAQAAIDEASEDEEDVGYPEPGDRVQHFAFGLCDVLGAEGDRLKLRDVKGGGRVREISTNTLTIEAPKLRDGYKVFRLSRGS